MITFLDTFLDVESVTMVTEGEKSGADKQEVPALTEQEIPMNFSQSS